MKSKYEDYENEDTDGAGFISGLFVGAILGACAALLYAPMSGEDTRQGIKDMAEKQKDNLKNQWDQTKEKAMDKASEIVNNTKDKIDSFGEQAKGAVDEYADKTKSKVDQLADGAKTTVDKFQNKPDYLG